MARLTDAPVPFVAAYKKHRAAAAGEFTPLYTEAGVFELAGECFETMATITDLPFVRLPLGLALNGEAPEKTELAEMAAPAPAPAVEIEFEGELKALIGHRKDKPGRARGGQQGQYRIKLRPVDMLERFAAKYSVEAVNFFGVDFAYIRLNMAL